MPRLDENVGREVTVEGTVSHLQQAHMFQMVAGKNPEKVDVPGWGQIVVYVKEKLPEGVKVKLTGIALRVGGGPPGSKAADFVEYQLDVSRWEVAK